MLSPLIIAVNRVKLQRTGIYNVVFVSIAKSRTRATCTRVYQLQYSVLAYPRIIRNETRIADIFADNRDTFRYDDFSIGDRSAKQAESETNDRERNAAQRHELLDEHCDIAFSRGYGLLTKEQQRACSVPVSGSPRR